MQRLGIVRPRDLRAHKLPGDALWRLARRGLLEQHSRGVYALAGHEFTEHHSLAEAAKRVPQGVISLLSALRAHNLTTQSPHEVWIAINRKARLPKSGAAKLRVVRFSGIALSEGIEHRQIEGYECRYITSRKQSRTVSNTATRSGWMSRSKRCAKRGAAGARL